MTDHERSISGLPANDYRVDIERANGVSGYDSEVLDAASAPWRLSYDVQIDDDATIEALVAEQLALDGEASSAQLSEVRTSQFARRIAGPALIERAA